MNKIIKNSFAGMQKVTVAILCFVGVLIIAPTGCVKRQVTDDLKIYKVEKIDDVFSWDEFVEKVEVIPLETNDSSVIGIFHKGIVTGNDIFVFDFRHHLLLNFDITGNFKRKIGKEGKGPEEYLEIRDFCVTGNHIYILDYQKIHRYSKITGEKEDSWSFDTRDGFNPMSMFVFDKDNYFLWNSNPNVRNPEQGEYYRMHQMQDGKVMEKYFKYEYPLGDDPRFYMVNEQSCYLRPMDGEDIVYKLTEDTLSAAFKIDFGDMAVTIPEIIELKNSTQPNAYLKSNKFKNISNVLEVKNYILFTCNGPDAFSYEGLISKHTGSIKIGRSYGASPRFFFSDGTFLYGYYEPFLIDAHKKNNTRNCFESIWLNSNPVSLEDNITLVKVRLK